MFPPVGGAGGSGGYDGDQAGLPPRGYPPQPAGSGGRGGGGRKPTYKKIINYPRWGKTGFRRWIPSWRLVSMIFLTGVLAMIAAVFAIYASVKIPPPDQEAQAQTTAITYGDGKTTIATIATQNRESVPITQIPLHVRQSVLSAEDHTFYTNSGIDPKSIARAVLANVRGRATQGGSTISQQYVKNVYNQRQRTLKRKFTEVFLAVKVNRQVSKDEILDRYLNTIYLGRGAYGIQAASHAYFNEDVSKLTVSQGAFLAGIINAPSIADPRASASGKARAEFRWTTVLNAMVKWGWLDPATRAKQTFPKTIVEKSTTTVTGQNAYLEQMAEQEAEQDLGGITKDQLETGGYKIVTTFDPTLVKQAAAAVKAKVPSNHSKGLRVGLASIDPRSGAVEAIYGGTNITKQLNQATIDRAQGGSTFKAFGLISALENGVSLKTEYDSKSPRKFPGVKAPVQNFGNESLGWINLIKATELSINTVFVQLNHDNGPQKTLAAALAAGLPPSTPDLKANLVNVLGSANVHPIDMASAYGIFADQGVHHPWFCVQSISKIGTGKVVFKTNRKSKRVFDTNAVDDLNYAFQQVVLHGTAEYASQLGRPAAGKTGTSNSSKSAWFIGYTPQLVTAVAFHQVGGDGKKIVPLSPMGGVGNITGGTFPAEVWTDYMEAALKGQKVLDFANPVYGGQVTTTPPASPTLAPPTQGPTPSEQPTTPGNTRPTVSPTTAPPTTSPTPSPTRTRFPVGPTGFPTPTRTKPIG